jgi:hypothetical protein
VSESKARWIERNAPRDRTGMFETPTYEDTGEQPQQPGGEPQQRPRDE